jgi:hypothetical protein
MGRSTSYFWDKLKEVPKRDLERWRDDRVAKQGLPLEDLLEMASLPDPPLNSKHVAEGVRYLYGLWDWMTVAKGMSAPTARGFVRFAASLSPTQRRSALTDEGLRFTALTPTQQTAYLRILPQEWLNDPNMATAFAGAKLRMVYVPASWYEWSSHPYGAHYPMVAAPTAEGTLEAARRFDPAASADRVHLSLGDLLLNLALGDGSYVNAHRLGLSPQRAPRR